jgi:hypothetical protein
MSGKLQEFEGFNLIEGADYAARGYPHPIWELSPRTLKIVVESATAWERTRDLRLR